MGQDKLVELGHSMQKLRQYLSAADADTPELADLEEYGFDSASELMNLFSAVKSFALRLALVELTGLFWQFEINSFTLSSSSLSPIGVAMSPVVALCNHSCWPNAVVVFPEGGKGIDIVAIRDIPVGEEVNYIEEQGVHERLTMVDPDELYRHFTTVRRKTSGSESAIWV